MFIYLQFFKSGWGEGISFFCNSLNFDILFTLLFQCIFFCLFQYRRMSLVVLVLNVFWTFHSRGIVAIYDDGVDKLALLYCF